MSPSPALPANVVDAIAKCIAAGMTHDRIARVLDLMAEAEANRRFGQPHHGHGPGTC